MIILPIKNGEIVGDIPADAVRIEHNTATMLATIYQIGDELPQWPSPPPEEDPYKSDLAAKQQAEFDAYKARGGAPIFKAAAVKIAAEKLGLLDTITAAIMALVDKAGDKSLYVWWQETDAISRGDAQWQEIEAAVEWGKGASADDLFALAAQI